MAVDRYTKVILTIIAGCLLWMCLKNTISTPTAAAAPSMPMANVQDVRIVAIQKPQSDKDWRPINVFTVNGN